jgi:hypothetical protein
VTATSWTGTDCLTTYHGPNYKPYTVGSRTQCGYPHGLTWSTRLRMASGSGLIPEMGANSYIFCSLEINGRVEPTAPTRATDTKPPAARL